MRALVFGLALGLVLGIGVGCGPDALPTAERPERRYGSFEAFAEAARTTPEPAGAALPRRRVVLVGLDGASWAYLRPLFERGALPNLARLAGEGATATLRSVTCHFTPPAWTSMFTGVLPHRHGVYSFGRWEPGRSEFAKVSSADVHVPPVWELASRAGLRVASIGVPVTWPATPVNGVLVTGLMTPKRHGPALELRAVDRPVPLDRTLRTHAPLVTAAFEDASNVFFAYLTDTEDDGRVHYDRVRLRVLEKGLGPPDARRLGVHDFAVGEYSPWVRVRVPAGLGGLRQDAWVKIRLEQPGPRRIGWHLSPTFERPPRAVSPPELADELEERFGFYLPHEFLSLPLLPSVTRDAAAHARHLLAREPWDLSLTVFGQTDNAHHLVGFAPEVLPVYREIDRFVGDVLAEAGPETIVVLASDHGFGAFGRAVDLNEYLARQGLLRWKARGEIDHERTLVFHNLWHLYFQRDLLTSEELAARGVPMEPGEEPAAALARHVIALGQQVQDDDGTPFPVEIVPIPAGAVGDPPDLAVRGSDAFWIEFWNVDQPSAQVVRRIEGDERWKHAHDGILAFWGADVPGGRDLGALDIQDVAPTLLDLLGLPVAEELDGQVIAGVLDASVDAQRPLRRVATYGPRLRQAPQEAEDDPTSFEETLRALGYLRD